MFELTVKGGFSAAHSLRGYQGPCEQLHGHNYKVDVVLRGEQLDNVGMLVDFKEVKRALNQITERLDHQFLNKVEPFTEVNASAEHIARHIGDELAGRLPATVGIKSVTVWESDLCAATYVP